MGKIMYGANMNQFFLFCLIVIQNFITGADQSQVRILTEEELIKNHIIRPGFFAVQRDFLPTKLKDFIYDFEQWKQEDKNALKVLFIAQNNNRNPHKISFDFSKVSQEKQQLYDGNLYNWFNNIVVKHEGEIVPFAYCVIYLKYNKQA